MRRFTVVLVWVAAGAVLLAADDKPKANPLHLTAAQRATAGINTSPVQKASLPAETEAYGRVLDPTPYVNLVAEVATARAAAAASQRELDRARQLFAAGGNTSAQTVETAEAAAARDSAALASAQLRLLAGWGRRLSEQADVAALKAMLAEGAALIRIDASGTERLPKSPTSAQVQMLGAGDESYPAEILDPAPVADPQVVGPSWLALVRRHSLPAGAALRVTLATGAASREALVIPSSAIVYHQGSAWAYELGKDDTFERKLITVGPSAPGDAVAVEGLDAGDQVAVTGAEQLLATELQAAAGADAGGD